MAASSRLLAVAAAVVAIGVGSFFAMDAWLKHKSFMFTTEEIGAIARASLQCEPCRGDPQRMMANITAELSRRYPGYIDEEDWIFMRAGGWMGAFKLLYASVTEYVLLFGTAVDTSGHSGRYWAEISDTLISGRFVQWDENTVKPHVHGPGTTVLHPAWAATGVQWDSGTWMLEHAQGIIPTTLGFAFSDGVFSTQDFWSLGKSVAVYAKHVTRNLLRGVV